MKVKKARNSTSKFRKFEYYDIRIMKAIKLNHENPTKMEARYLAEIKKMSAQQRFEKLMAIIEISYLLRNAKKLQKN